MNNILEICQEVADMTATQRPDDLFDKNVLHDAIFLSVAKSELDSLMRYGDWQELIKQGRFETIENKAFYPFDEVVGDFYALIHNTVYIQNEGKQAIGAITPEKWMKTLNSNPHQEEINFRIENNGLRFMGKPKAGLKVVFLYRSNAICIDAKTREPKCVLSKNTDIPVFDKYLVKLGIVWRLNKRNGMDYEEEYNEYQKELKKQFGRELGTQDIRLAGENFLKDEIEIYHVK